MTGSKELVLNDRNEKIKKNCDDESDSDEDETGISSGFNPLFGKRNPQLMVSNYFSDSRMSTNSILTYPDRPLSSLSSTTPQYASVSNVNFEPDSD